ncbi:MAG TPA: tripartite tricarboxylate transporter substrate binding protein [Burkholderiales bacterium]|nr:tripartite tricarboxylate transporter substrate binding protein [Burkholderiales bacterium]
MRRYALTAALVCAASAAAADNYPDRPVRAVVPFAPGGAVDIVARMTAQRLGEALGQTVVVDNRGGAGGTIGTDIVAKARPDGYTLLIGSMGVAVSAVLYPKLPYDTLRDLAPITMLAEQPNIVVVHPSVPAKSVRDLVALAKAKPGQVTYGSGGVGSNSHFATVLFLMKANVEMLHVPYKGLGPAITELVGGQVQMAVSNVSTALPHVKSGKLRLLAVTTKKRFGLFPDTPTVDESGVPGYESSGWYALWAPARTPRDIVSKLHGETTKALTSAAMREQLRTQGLEPIPTTPEAFDKRLRAEIAQWAKVVKATGATPD